MDVLFPVTVAELQAMQSAEPAGMIMAGGTDLLVRLRKMESCPPVLFCIERLTELQDIEVNPTEIRIGAAVTLERILDCDVVRDKIPVLFQAARSMASPPVRHAATLGGNICTASPAGDTLPPLYVLGAAVLLSGPAGPRRLPIASFIAGPGKTVAKQGEFLTDIIIPLPSPGTFSTYHKVGKRQAMAIAVASLAIAAAMNEDKSVKSIKLAWGSVGPQVIMLPAVENYLAGRHLTPEVLREAGWLAAAGVAPIDDVRAGADYRRHLAGNLLLRLIAEPMTNMEMMG
jgi:CO/xanthine dehydrogenase FAD-binding subunit